MPRDPEPPSPPVGSAATVLDAPRSGSDGDATSATVALPPGFVASTPGSLEGHAATVLQPSRPEAGAVAAVGAGALAPYAASGVAGEAIDVGPGGAPRSLGEAVADAGRYEFRRVLGAGGMGEVKLCRDARIGREVALKQMHAGPAAHSDALARFVREARVQGQLEHPSVVPVYDLGAMPDGTAFFTMKRVKGVTLEAVLRGLAANDPELARQYTRRRLLLAFVSVCHALEYAHARGVLHRDLKPANVMLGSYGEVHLLDWGLAKVSGASDEASAGEHGEAIDDGLAHARGATMAGALMGTPGYMAPEQVRGEVHLLDARADVYALGVLLFEVLALRSLHAAASVAGLLQGTLEGVDARPSARSPERDVPPELDAVCVRATALARDERYPTVQALREDVERFLDGDRDLERRREMAAQHAQAARDAAVRAVAGASSARAEAMREISRALALDPQQTDALTALAFLLMNAPDDVPPEAVDELRARTHRTREHAARLGAVRFASWLVFVPCLLWMGGRDYLTGGLCIAAIALSALVSRGIAASRRTNMREGFVLLTLSNVAIGLLSGAFGPFVLVPALAATNAVFFATYASVRARPFIALAGVLALTLPMALELLGVVAPSYRAAHGTLVLLPRMTELPPVPTLVTLLLAHAALVVTPTLLAGRMRDALDEAERRVFLQSWLLQQMVPEEARSSLHALRAEAPARTER